MFEISVQTGELWKAGFRVKLQSQPFKVLLALVERPGEIVTREELQLRVWGRDTNVDFDHSLGTAINKIREALGDSADNPRFIETLARRGYRFIAPVHPAETIEFAPMPRAAAAAMAPALSVTTLATGFPELHPPAEQPEAVAPRSPAVMVEPPAVQSAAALLPATAAQPHTRVPAGPLLWALAGLVACGLLAWLAFSLGRSQAAPRPVHIAQITHNGHLAASIVNMENLAASATDGVHLYATIFDNGRAELAAIALSEGTVSRLDVPEEVASPALGDISPDGSRLLLRDHLSPESEQPLWVVPTLGGSALRVGSALAHDATWMPDGHSVLFANGNQLLRAELNGGSAPEVYATLPGRGFWLRWSPDGSLLRFTLIDPLTHTLSLWQLTGDDRQPRQILAGFHDPASECCGVWTPDGRWFVFQSSRGGNTDIWRLRGGSTSNAERVTDGPLQFQAPVTNRTGDRLYFLGVDARSELARLTHSGELVPERGFLSDAMRVEYTRDNRSVAWTDTAGRLWRAGANGDERLQLTPDDLDVFMVRWSPDATHLALMARAPGKAWGLYLVGADGSDLRQLLHEARNAADPSWSPDGHTLVFGRTNDRMGEESSRSLLFFDLRTGAVRPVPGSEGLFSPRWSPDGRYIIALSLDQRRAELFDVAAGSWRPLPVPSAADPVWSADSQTIFLHASLSPAQPIDLVHIPDGHVEELTKLGTATGANAVDYVLSGLAADGSPLIRTRVYTGDLFSVDLTH